MNLEYLSTALAYRVRLQDTEGDGSIARGLSTCATDSSGSTETKRGDADIDAADRLKPKGKQVGNAKDKAASTEGKVIEDGGLLLDESARVSRGAAKGADDFVCVDYQMPTVLSAVAKAAVCIHDPYQMWQLIEQSVQQQLVEFKYKWKERILENLELEFIPGADKRNDLSQSSYLNGYKFPHVYLYLVKCDDLEAYKSNVKLRLQAWVDKLKKVAGKGQVDFEWFIVYVPKKESPRGSGLLKKPNSRQVFDRIKADFNHSPHPARSRKDKDKDSANRCCKISLFETHSDSPGKASAQLSHVAARAAKMSDFLEMLCSKLAAAFDQRYGRLQEEISAKEELRYSNGWNFYNFFVLKESLAFLWIQIGQYKDALAVYDSLADLFVELSQSRTLDNSTPHETHALYNASLKHLKRRPTADHDLPMPPPMDSHASTGFETPKPVPRNADGTDPGSRRSSPLLASSNSSKKTLSLAMSYGKNAASFNSPRRSIRRRHTSSAASKATTGTANTTPPPTGSTISESVGSMSPGFGYVGSGTAAGNGKVAEETVIPSWLLDVTRKSFRDQIFTNNVSTVDLEMYIFARQALLLLAMHLPGEALRRGMQVIGCIGGDIANKCSFVKDQKEDITLTSTEARLIADAWTFCASIDLICAANTSIARATAQISHDAKKTVYGYIDAILADAQRSLNCLAATACPSVETDVANDETDDLVREWKKRNRWLQRLPPFVWNRSPVPISSHVLNSQVLADWLPGGLLQAITRRDAFLSLYNQIFDCRAAHCTAVDRNRLAASLSFQRATVLFAFGNVETALQAVTKTINANAVDTWPALAGEVLELRMHCEKRVGSATNVITAFLETLRPTLPLQHRARAQAGLSELQAEEDPNAPLLQFPLMKYPIVSLETTCDKSAASVYIGEQARITVNIFSTLPEACTFKEIRLCLQTKQSGRPAIPLEQAKSERFDEETLHFVLVEDDQDKGDGGNEDEAENDSSGSDSGARDEGEEKRRSRGRALSCEDSTRPNKKMLRRKRSSTIGARLRRLSNVRRKASWLSKRKVSRSQRRQTTSGMDKMSHRRSSAFGSAESVEAASLELQVLDAHLLPGRNAVQLVSTQEATQVGEYILTKWTAVLGSILLESAVSPESSEVFSLSSASSPVFSVKAIPVPQVLRFSELNCIVCGEQREVLEAQKLFFKVETVGTEAMNLTGQLQCRSDDVSTHWRLYRVDPERSSSDTAQLLPVNDGEMVAEDQKLDLASLSNGDCFVVELEVGRIEPTLPDELEIEVVASLRAVDKELRFSIANMFTVPVLEPFFVTHQVLRIENRSFLKIKFFNALDADLQVLDVSAKNIADDKALSVVGNCTDTVVLAHGDLSLMYSLDVHEPGTLDVTVSLNYKPVLPYGLQTDPAQYCKKVALIAEEVSAMTVDVRWASMEGSTMTLGSGVYVHYSLTNEVKLLRVVAADDTVLGQLNGQTTELYELKMNDEDWLVVGKDKGRLKMGDASSNITELGFHLVPLRVGLVQLPRLELKHRLARRVDGDGKGRNTVRIEP